MFFKLKIMWIWGCGLVSRVLALACMKPWVLGPHKPDVMEPVHNLSSQEGKAEGPEFQNSPWLHSELRPTWATRHPDDKQSELVGVRGQER